MIVDSHCHLDYSQLYDQLDNVLKRAHKNKVKYFLTICTNLDSFEIIKLIINKYENIFGTFGIHPHETEKFLKVDCKRILDAKEKNKKIIGIGETGLDYYYTHSDKKIQRDIFIEHIKASSLLDIPLIVHSRNAENDTIDIIKNMSKNSKLKVILHCFTGTKDFAKKLLDLNCYISFSGIITFKNTSELAEVAKFVPLDKLLVETDSPYLSPIPYRGKSNEPSYIIHTINKLAQIKNISEDIVSESTTRNFKKLFDLN